MVYEGSSNENINATLEIYTDADYAGDRSDRKSTSGIAVKMFGQLVDWSTRKQRPVTISTAEAEYLALSAATTTYYVWRNVLQEIGVNVKKPITLNCDSSSAIAIAETYESKRSRHVDMAYHNVREAVLNGELKLKKINTKEQLADLFTKALPRESFEYFR